MYTYTKRDVSYGLLVIVGACLFWFCFAGIISCSLSVKEEDQQRLDVLNIRLANVENEIFELRKEIAKAREEGTGRLDTLNENLDRIADEVEKITQQVEDPYGEDLDSGD